MSRALAWLRRQIAVLQGRVRYRVTGSGYLFGAALAIVGAAAVASGNNLLFLVLASMLATLLISGLVSRLCLAGLVMELQLPEHVAARQSTVARIRMRNGKWFPSFAVYLKSDGDTQILHHEVSFPLIPGRDVVEIDVPATFPRRGAHIKNLFWISTRFPFGFVDRRAPVALQSSTVVYPALDPTPLAEDLLRSLKDEIERQQRGRGSEFYRLRPYEHRESARHIDWKSTAHVRQLQVREFTREERPQIDLVFDRSGPAGEGFERRVECCAFLVWALTERANGLRLRSQGVSLRYPAEDDVYAMLNFLALVEAGRSTAEIPDHADSPAHVLFTAQPQALAATLAEYGQVVADSDVLGEYAAGADANPARS